MRIVDIEPIWVQCENIDVGRADSTQDALFVRVVTDEGVVGIGEADTPPEVGRAIIQMASSHAVARGLADLLIGQNPLEIDRLWHEMFDCTYTFGRTGAVLHVMSGIDMALWDIAGKVAGVPVSELLGGARVSTIPVYASEVMPSTPAEVETLVQHALRSGFNALKLGWGPLGADVGLDVELIQTARAALGPARRLMIDLGMRGTVKSTLRLLDLVGDADLFWLEEPLRWDDYDGYRRLSAATPVRIATGEAHSTVAPFRELAAIGHVDVLQPDLARCGGFTVARRVADLQREFSVEIVPHCFASGVSIAACLHYVATLDRPLMTEFPIAASPLTRDVIGNPFTLENGHVGVPSGPGLGVSLDMELIEQMRGDTRRPEGQH